MFEDNVLESRPHAREEVGSPQTVPAVGRAPNAKSLNQEVEARAPVRQERPRRMDRIAGSARGRTAAGDQQKNPGPASSSAALGSAPRSDASRRGPWAAATFIWTTLSASSRPTMPSSRRDSPRSLPRFPVTSPAVPVTDNEHVAAGRRDRPHRRPRLTASRSIKPRRKWRRRKPASRNIDAQLQVQQAQIKRQRGAGRAGAGGAGVRGAGETPAIRIWRKKARAPSRMPEVQLAAASAAGGGWRARKRR